MLSQPLILTMANCVDALKAHNTWNKHQYITWRRRVALGNPLAVMGNPTDDAVSAYPELAWAVFVSTSKSPRSYSCISFHFYSPGVTAAAIYRPISKKLPEINIDLNATAITTTGTVCVCVVLVSASIQKAGFSLVFQRQTFGIFCS